MTNAPQMARPLNRSELAQPVDPRTAATISRPMATAKSNSPPSRKPLATLAQAKPDHDRAFSRPGARDPGALELQSDGDRQQREGQRREMQRLFAPAAQRRRSSGFRGRARIPRQAARSLPRGPGRSADTRRRTPPVHSDAAAMMSAPPKRRSSPSVGFEQAREIEHVYAGPRGQSCCQPRATAVRIAPEQQRRGRRPARRRGASMNRRAR